MAEHDKVLDDLLPKLKEASKALDVAAEAVFDPAVVSHAHVAEHLSTEEQLQLYVGSAHAIIATMLCQRRFKNEAPSAQLLDQVQRLRTYIDKLKREGVPMQAASAAGKRRPRETTADALTRIATPSSE
jgi:hypothetical protein